MSIRALRGGLERGGWRREGGLRLPLRGPARHPASVGRVACNGLGCLSRRPAGEPSGAGAPEVHIPRLDRLRLGFPMYM